MRHRNPASDPAAVSASHTAPPPLAARNHARRSVDRRRLDGRARPRRSPAAPARPRPTRRHRAAARQLPSTARAAISRSRLERKHARHACGHISPTLCPSIASVHARSATLPPAHTPPQTAPLRILRLVDQPLVARRRIQQRQQRPIRCGATTPHTDPASAGTLGAVSYNRRPIPAYCDPCPVNKNATGGAPGRNTEPRITCAPRSLPASAERDRISAVLPPTTARRYAKCVRPVFALKQTSASESLRSR